MLTPEAIAEIEARARAATDGPWRQGDGVFSRNAVLAAGSVDTCAGATVWATIFHADLVEAQDEDGRQWYTRGTSEANATFIAHAREDVPTLIAALREAEAVRGLLADCLGHIDEVSGLLNDLQHEAYRIFPTDEEIEAKASRLFELLRSRHDRFSGVGLMIKAGNLDESLLPSAQSRGASDTEGGEHGG